MCLQTSTGLHLAKFLWNELDGEKYKRGEKKQKQCGGWGRVGELHQSPLPTKPNPQHVKSYFENISSIRTKEKKKQIPHTQTPCLSPVLRLLSLRLCYQPCWKTENIQFSNWKKITQKTTWSSETNESLLFHCMNFRFSIFIDRHYYCYLIFTEEIKLQSLYTLSQKKMTSKFCTVDVIPVDTTGYIYDVAQISNQSWEQIVLKYMSLSNTLYSLEIRQNGMRRISRQSRGCACFLFLTTKLSTYCIKFGSCLYENLSPIEE